MGNHIWQQLRVVHDMLRWKQPTLVQALARKRRADRYHVHPCRLRRLHTSRRIFDDQTLFRLHLQFTGQEEIDLRIRLAMFDIVSRGNKVECIGQAQRLEDVLYLVTVGHCCQADPHT